MKSTLNWTGRISIPRDVVQLRISEGRNGLPSSFSANLDHLRDLESLKSSLDARIYVEPYVGASSMRFDFGTLRQVRNPEDTGLHELDAGGRILFRVKVVDESDGSGKILAAANEIAPDNETDDQNRKPLLPVRFRDLGEEIWKIEFLPGPPLLVLNNRVAALGDRIRVDPFFQGAILPIAVERVLRAVLKEECGDEEWAEDWKKFAAQLNDGVAIDVDQDEADLETELENLMQRFNQKHAWITRYRSTNPDGHYND